MVAMTEIAPARQFSTTIIPAFEAGGSLLALLPKTALGRNHHIDIVVMDANTGSKALVAELKSYSTGAGTESKRTPRRVTSYDIDLFVQTYPDQDHGQSATALTALLARLHRALQRIAGAAGDELVHRALARPSDMGAVIDLLRSTLPLLSAEQELDPDLANQVSSLAVEDELIRRAGGLKTAKWVADYLAITPKSVAAKARRGEVLALTRGDRNLYPAFQFQDGQVLTGLRELLEALPLTNGWSQLSFLLTPNPGLDDRSPLKAFKTDREAVLAVAASADSQGAA